MNRYETILKLGDDFLILIRKGLIPVHILDWKVYYEAYISQCQKHKPSEAVNIVAAMYDISKRGLYKIIQYMKEGA